MFKKAWLVITALWWAIIFLLNWLGVLETAKDVFDKRGAIAKWAWLILTWQWLPLGLFLLGVVVIVGHSIWQSRRGTAKTINKERSKIRVSCGKSVAKSVVTANGETWYRARLDLEGSVAIPDIEAIVTDLWQDEVKVRLQENLTLTMHPGLRHPNDPNLITLREGSPEFVDVIRVGDGIAHFPLKFYPKAVDHHKLLTPAHTYKATVLFRSHSPSHRPLLCLFEFEWTGDADTCDIRLLSVTEPSSATNKVRRQHSPEVNAVIKDAVQLLRENPELRNFPVRALQMAGAGNLQTEQDFAKACEGVIQHSFTDPLVGLRSLYTAGNEPKWLEVIQSANKNGVALSSPDVLLDCVTERSKRPS